MLDGWLALCYAIRMPQINKYADLIGRTLVFSSGERYIVGITRLEVPWSDFWLFLFRPENKGFPNNVPFAVYELERLFIGQRVGAYCIKDATNK